MQVTPTSFTVAEYCGQMKEAKIVVNRDYQRSNKVWPPAARSYLIDTILLGYPMPKFSLYQKTDLRTRETLKEIVDGQQRSQAIYDFFCGSLRISGRSRFSGKRYSQLDEVDQQNFLDYQLVTDVFVGATEEDIREIFRRINSYNVPLNPQEKRHAVYQGTLKWFIVEMSRRYAESLKRIGVFGESQLSRMADSALFAEILLAILSGVTSASEKQLDDLYKLHEGVFPEETAVEQRFDNAISRILAWQPLHRGPLMKPYMFYSLVLATTHTLDPVAKLDSVYAREGGTGLDDEVGLLNLSVLAEAIDNPSAYPQFKEFVDAGSKGTNRLSQRQIRFKWLCRAVQGGTL